jgi:hypothetical protein
MFMHHLAGRPHALVRVVGLVVAAPQEASR